MINDICCCDVSLAERNYEDCVCSMECYNKTCNCK